MAGFVGGHSLEVRLRSNAVEFLAQFGKRAEN